MTSERDGRGDPFDFPGTDPERAADPPPADSDTVDDSVPPEPNLPLGEPIGEAAQEGSGVAPATRSPRGGDIPTHSSPGDGDPGGHDGPDHEGDGRERVIGNRLADNGPAGTDTPPSSPDGTSDHEGIVEEVVEAAHAAFVDRDGPLPTPEPEDLRDRYFDFSYLDEYDEIDRTWVTAPDAYVSTLYDHRNDRHRYHVSEPTLDPFETYVRRDFEGELRDRLMYEDIDEGTVRGRVVADRADDLLSKYVDRVDPLTLQKVRYYLLREFVGVGKIDPLMGDPDVEDVSCVGVDIPVYVYHNAYRDMPTNVSFDGDRLNAFVSRLAARSGKHVSVSNPLVDATMPGGSRVQLTLGRDISSRGSNFTVRKFAEVPRTPVQLIEWGTYSLDAMAYLWLAVQNDMSMLFAGGTASGKTTTMNACGFFIPPDSKVVSIEDTREITLPHDNWIQSVSRDSFGADRRGEITTHGLLQSGLRQRPEFLLVGEMRTESEVALTFFQAISTGHSGYSTIHADSAESVFDRLGNPPLSVPDQLLRSLDVVAVQKQQFVGDRRVRRNTELVEIVRTREGGIGTNTMFSWDPATDGFESDPRSYVFEEIKDSRGWSERRLRREYDARRVVLEFLSRNGIVDFAPVTRTIHAFARRPDAVIDAIRDGELDPENPDTELLSDVHVGTEPADPR